MSEPDKKRDWSQPKVSQPRLYRKPTSKRKSPETLPTPRWLVRQVDEVLGE